jgi:hypothetical protein
MHARVTGLMSAYILCAWMVVTSLSIPVVSATSKVWILCAEFSAGSSGMYNDGVVVGNIAHASVGNVVFRLRTRDTMLHFGGLQHLALRLRLFAILYSAGI